MSKKIAVVVRDRQGEALRMAVGLTLADDEISVYVMDNKLEMNDEIEMNLEAMEDMDIKVYTNNPENKLEQKDTATIAKELLDYDVVVPY